MEGKERTKGKESMKPFKRNIEVEKNLIFKKVKGEMDKRGWELDAIEWHIDNPEDPKEISFNIVSEDITMEEAVEFYEKIFEYAEEVPFIAIEYPIWITEKE